VGLGLPPAGQAWPAGAGAGTPGLLRDRRKPSAPARARTAADRHGEPLA